MDTAVKILLALVVVAVIILVVGLVAERRKKETVVSARNAVSSPPAGVDTSGLAGGLAGLANSIDLSGLLSGATSCVDKCGGYYTKDVQCLQDCIGTIGSN
jgi:hypothetical protein